MSKGSESFWDARSVIQDFSGILSARKVQNCYERLHFLTLHLGL
jgi:hypothetical protein